MNKLEQELTEILLSGNTSNEACDDAKDANNTIDSSYQLVCINPRYTTNDIVLRRLMNDAQWKYNTLIMNQICYN